MTRVCVTWDREETARLIARCREALAQTVILDREVLVKAAAEALSYQCGGDHGYEDEAQIAVDALPPLSEALNRALTAVLDGIAATLGDGYQSRLHDVEHALTSLAAIAEVLGVQEGS